jgi:hypothetical protein
MTDPKESLQSSKSPRNVLARTFDVAAAGNHRSSCAGRHAILFGKFRLLPTARLLLKDRSPVHVGDRALDILIARVERAGEVVSNAELLAIIWPKMSIDQSALRVHIAALRRALGHAETESRFIVTVRTRIRVRCRSPADIRRRNGGHLKRGGGLSCRERHRHDEEMNDMTTNPTGDVDRDGTASSEGDPVAD